MAATVRPTATTTLRFLLFFFFFFGLLFPSLFSLSAPENSLAVPVWKDDRTLQYVTNIAQGTPSISRRLVLDLGGPFLWLDCHSDGDISPSFFPVRCRSIQCSAARATGGGGGICNCNDNKESEDTCRLFPQNTLNHKSSAGELVEDLLALPLPSTQGFSKPIAQTRFLFSCAPTLLLRSLASGAQGMLGLGRSRISLPSQIAAAFGFHRKFAICLPSSSSSTLSASQEGVIFFGDGPYLLHPDMDASKYLMYTPLIVNPLNPSTDHILGVKSIKVNGKSVPLNASLLSIDGKGIGGTKISTVVPYTTMETSIFVALTEAFSVAAINTFNMTRVASVPPFRVCFSSNNIDSDRTGQVVVPTIDLVLQSEMVYWRIWGSNSMVKVNEDVLCLAILDGGLRPINSIVVGGYQLENNLLQFDLASSRLGFSSSLLGKQTTCSRPSVGVGGSLSYQR